jgi:hypothetical protein
MCVKNDVEDKDMSSVLNRVTSILNMHSWWSRDPSNQIWLGAFDSIFLDTCCGVGGSYQANFADDKKTTV